jgi:hypothetical protein
LKNSKESFRGEKKQERETKKDKIKKREREKERKRKREKERKREREKISLASCLIRKNDVEISEEKKNC